MASDLIQRDSVVQLVENFDLAVADVKQAYALLHSAKKRLNASYAMPAADPDGCSICPVWSRSCGFCPKHTFTGG